MGGERIKYVPTCKRRKLKTNRAREQEISVYQERGNNIVLGRGWIIFSFQTTMWTAAAPWASDLISLALCLPAFMFDSLILFNFLLSSSSLAPVFHSVISLLLSFCSSTTLTASLCLSHKHCGCILWRIPSPRKISADNMWEKNMKRGIVKKGES